MIEGPSLRAGRLVVVQGGKDGYSAFVPAPLPPEPPLRINEATQTLLDEANQALGRLDGVTLLFRTRASSSTPTSARKRCSRRRSRGRSPRCRTCCLFENEAVPGVPLDDVEETANYIAAMNHGLRRIESGELP